MRHEKNSWLTTRDGQTPGGQPLLADVLVPTDTHINLKSKTTIVLVVVSSEKSQRVLRSSTKQNCPCCFFVSSERAENSHLRLREERIWLRRGQRAATRWGWRRRPGRTASWAGRARRTPGSAAGVTGLREVGTGSGSRGRGPAAAFPQSRLEKIQEKNISRCKLVVGHCLCDCSITADQSLTDLRLRRLPGADPISASRPL